MADLSSSQYETLIPDQEESLDDHGLAQRIKTVVSFLSDKRHAPYILSAVILFSILLSIEVARTRRPWCDEAWFASPAYNLDHHGVMGMTVLDPHGFVFAPYVEGIGRFTYWVMPGYLLLQAAWYKLVGLSLFSMRAISIFWSAVALWSWFIAVRWLTSDARIALLAAFLLGTEQHFVLSAATGRMDMMCAALGLLSLTLYILLRQRFALALFVAACVSAINLFTHPNAIFGMLALAFVVLVFDREHVSLPALLLAICPFLLLGTLWGLYVARAPQLLVAQLQAQAKIPHRLEIPWNPWKGFGQEMLERYGSAYGLTTRFPASLGRIIVALYAAAIGTALVIPQLRKQRATMILLILTGASFALLMCLQKNWYYLIFIIPYYTAIVAIISGWLWHRSANFRFVVASLLGLVTVLHLGIVGARIVHNDYRSRYLAATNYLKRNTKPNDLIMGSGELAFELGFDGQVLDDSRLGFLSGKRPKFIVVESLYGNFWFPWYSVHEPATHRHIVDLFTHQYELVYDQTGDRYPTYGFSDRPYQILKRRAVPLQ